MITVEEALARCLALATRLGSETVPLREANGRVMAEPATARLTQPPFAASAMDGYALGRNAEAGDQFTVIGEAGAGHGFAGSLAPQDATRIFTGAPLPTGAVTIAIQEDVTANGQSITVNTATKTGDNIRPQGQDFALGDTLSPRLLRPNDLALLAAMNVPTVAVTRRPVVALIATGDELVMPGEQPGPDQIIASNTFALAAMIEAAGATPSAVVIALDRQEKATDRGQEAPWSAVQFVRQQLGLPVLKPLRPGQRLTLWTMSRPATVETDALVAAGIVPGAGAEPGGGTLFWGWPRRRCGPVEVISPSMPWPVDVITLCCAEAWLVPNAPSSAAPSAPKLKSRLNHPLRFMTQPSFENSSTSPSPLMVVSHLSKSVQDASGTLHILRDIDFHLAPQQSLAIVGASGSGKSTLLSIMAGLDTPTQGTVWLGGVDLFAMDEDARAAVRARQVGFVFQSFQLLGNMTALENVMLPLELAGLPNPRAAAKDMLVRVGLGERLGHYPKVLSGGEQ